MILALSRHPNRQNSRNLFFIDQAFPVALLRSGHSTFLPMYPSESRSEYRISTTRLLVLYKMMVIPITDDNGH
jgi:hypothetical protein